MTSINAIRFNWFEGACLCDESITSSDSMRLDVSDKFQPCLPQVIVDKFGTVAAMGTTGTISTGAHIKQSFTDRMTRLYESEVEKRGKAPARFISLAEMSVMLFDLIVENKYTALSEKFQGHYGFSSDEFIQGDYRRGEETFEIKDRDTVREICALLGWKYQQEELAHLFNNAAILAGFDDQTGFGIFHYDLRGGYWHKVQNCYLAEGSGRHSVDPAMYPFIENLLVTNRQGEIDRVAGILALIQAMNTAAEHEIGVGGYPNILVIDGREKDFSRRIHEINDERSLLASHLVKALGRGYLSYADCYSLIDELIFGRADFQSTFDKFFSKINNQDACSRLLRGYKMLPYYEDILISPRS
jgi:hypothetical protein